MNFKQASIAIIPICLLSLSLTGMGPISGARAQQSHEYVIAGNDGYGVQDCLAEAGPCGQVVADAWCESHGQGPAISFGPQSAANGMATKVASTDETYVIKCGN